MITINYIGYVTEKMQVQKKASYLERKKKKDKCISLEETKE